MRRHLILVFLLSAAWTTAPAQSVFNAWTVQGVRVKITAASAASGVTGSANSVFRVFYDRERRLVFGYELLAERVSPGDTFHVVAKPLTAEYLRNHPTETLAPGYDAQHLPTLDSQRELPLVVAGDQASIDIPLNSPAGASVTDTVQVSLETMQQMRAQEAATTSYRYFDMRNVKVFLNGKLITPDANRGGVAGEHILLYLPGHGAFVFTNEPLPGYSFEQLGYVNGNKLSFSFQADNYECVTDAPILPRVENAEIWVIHDPDYQPKAWTKSPKDEFFTAGAGAVRNLLPLKPVRQAQPVLR